MVLGFARPVGGAVDGALVLGLLRDPSAWHRWLPVGTVIAQRGVRGGGREVDVTLPGPRPIHLLLHVEERAEGVGWSVLDGDLATAGHVDLTSDGQLRWHLELTVPAMLPGALVRELEEVLLSTWTDALLDAASRPGGDQAS